MALFWLYNVRFKVKNNLIEKEKILFFHKDN